MALIRPTGVKFGSLTGGALVALVWLAGCGGSGGASPDPPGSRVLGDACQVGTPAGSVAYLTRWGTAPATASQVVEVVDVNGSVVRADSANRGPAPETRLTVPSILPGVYELRARLFSEPNAAGTELGRASQVVDLCGDRAGNTVSVSTAAGTAAARIQVSPAELAIDQQQTLRFVASAWDAAGHLAFTSPSSVQWNVQGTIGTVSAAGVFTATKSGSGAVRAELGATGLADGGTVTVRPVSIKRGKWTVLVYMNAANDLYPASSLNVNQMEEVAGNPDVRFVVQWKQSKDAFSGSSFDGVRRYLVKFDTSPQIVSPIVQNNLVDSAGNALDMGDAQTLADFVSWGKRFYPADRYVLVVWNHGSGWQRGLPTAPTRAFSFDDQYGTAIQTWEIGTALRGQQFDILAWDASLMQMMEVAYEAAPFAKFVAGSEESPPADGYPYHLAFRGFRDAPDAPTRDLARGFVDAMLAWPPYSSRKITQSVIETSRLPALATAVDGLADSLIQHASEVSPVIPQVRSQAQAYSPGFGRHYLDLADVCRLLRADPRVPAAVKQRAQAVQTAVASAVVWEGNNANSPHSNGVSIDFSPGSTFLALRHEYIRLRFGQDTRWDEWLGIAP